MSLPETAASSPCSWSCSSSSRSRRRSSCNEREPHQHPPEHRTDRHRRLPGDAAAHQRPVRPLGRLHRRLHRPWSAAIAAAPTGAPITPWPAACGSRWCSASRLLALVVGVINARQRHGVPHQRADHDAGHAGDLPRSDEGRWATARRSASMASRASASTRIAGPADPGLHLRRRRGRVLHHAAIHDLRPLDVRHRRQPHRGSAGRHPDRPSHLHRLHAVGGSGRTLGA